MLLCLLLPAGASVHASPVQDSGAAAFDTLWQQVSLLEEESLPESSAKAVDEIYRKAMAEKNSPQLLKATVHLLKYQWATDRDAFPDKLPEMEAYAENASDTVEKCVLHSMLANLYLQYYQANSRTIDRRTALSGPVPEDVREWTGNIFIRQIIAHANRSLEPARLLQSADVLTYRDILTEGDASRNLRPTLYDFLAAEAIRIFSAAGNQSAIYFNRSQKLPDSCFAPAEIFAGQAAPPAVDSEYDLTLQILHRYRQLLAFRLAGSNRHALLMADLDRLEFVSRHASDSCYSRALHHLQKQYENDPMAVEILFRLANASYPQDYPYLEKLTAEAAEKKKRACDLCRAGILQFPGYERIDLLKNRLAVLTAPQMRASVDRVAYPGQAPAIEISFRNIPQIDVRVYRILLPADSCVRSGLYETHGEAVDVKTHRLHDAADYLSQDTVLALPALPVGMYEIVLSYTPENGETTTNVRTLVVSRLTSVHRVVAGKNEYLVTDRISGRPIEKATVGIYRKTTDSYEFLRSAVTDRNGIASVSPIRKGKSQPEYYRISYGDDVYWPFTWAFMIADDAPNPQSADRLDIFIDRSLYRPGQTVFFKGIITRTDRDAGQSAPAGISRRILLMDANDKQIAEKTCISNDFGSFSGSFVLPKQTLGGIFRLTESRDSYINSCSFRVEEYRRPTFDIVTDTVSATAGFGDSIPVAGIIRTFSGVPLQEIPVDFRVMRKKHGFWRFAPDEASGQVASGTVTTDIDGRFSLSFVARRPDGVSPEIVCGYTFEVEISATSTAGETQQSLASVVVGDRSMYLDAELSARIDKDNLPALSVRAFNLNGKRIYCNINYRICRLSDDKALDKTMEDKDRTETACVDSGTFNSRDSLRIPHIAQKPSGRYRLVLQAKDDKGRDVEHRQDFVLCSARDKRPPVMRYQWLTTGKTACAPGEKAEIVYGSSARNVYVLYELFLDGKNIRRERFVLNNENRRLTVPFLPSYGKGVDATFTFVKDGRCFTERVGIVRKEDDRGLRLKMDVFRDRLLPGQSEEWKLSVRDAQGKPVSGEVLASMYDLSLDKIYKAGEWRLSPPDIVPVKTAPLFYAANDYGRQNFYFPVNVLRQEVPAFAFDGFNWFGLSLRGNALTTLRFSGTTVAVRGEQAKVAVADAIETLTGAIETLPVPNGLPSGEMAGNTSAMKYRLQEEAVQVRGNFSETAFFYPQLRTDDAGGTVIAFTVPESNTAWMFRALAHTADARSGSLAEQVVTRKPLMVAPNMPRFVRQGDVVTLSTNVSNTSDAPQSGTALMQLLDPQTEAPLMALTDSIRTFRIESGQTAAVSWTFRVPESIDLMMCRIVARSEDFSDGEQHVLPVLPRRVLVTESLPLSVSGKGEQRFRFDGLLSDTSSTAENFRVTLEYASNPAWYAIQALPAMSEPENESAVSVFSSYYTGRMATAIANRTPEIRRMIETWNLRENAAETLRSSLEKNRELKGILPEETPWLLDAAGETEQRQRLIQLFDENRNRYLASDAIRKLKELQMENGGWAWFRGMHSSVSITQWILYGMGQLARLHDAGTEDDVREMQQKALAFIDREFRKSFDDMKKSRPGYAKMQAIDGYPLEYLFARSFYPDTAPGDAGEAIDFYLNVIEKYWPQTDGLYRRALAAMILHRNGRDVAAAKIARSLKEHAVRRPDTGMYWANSDPHSFFFRSAVSVHTFIMQALAETGVSPEDTEAMKLWLLRQKQAQRWESTPATVNAIHALLNTGSDLLKGGSATDIRIGRHTVRTSAGEAGTGYVKRVFSASEITADMGNIVISGQDGTPACGAVYRQYFENADKVASSGNSLRVDRQLFVEKVTANGKTLLPAKTSGRISTGDRVVVRLTVRADRDMEYVMLKDARAACFEPAAQVSGVQWKESLMYYRTDKDASTHFYFDHLPKGTYVFEYALYAAHPGEYSDGVTAVQCLYAPEFVGRAQGGRVSVSDSN
jgi:hypothetical protein